MQNIMNTPELDRRADISDYIFMSKYARTINGKKETWQEAVTRVMTMHWHHLEHTLALSEDRLTAIRPYFDTAFEYYLDKKVLGAQRALQYGGDQLRKHNGRMYNCTGSYLNRTGFFKEVFYALLCGMGAGYSVQSVHIDMLPAVSGYDESCATDAIVIEDSIEGWSLACDSLINAHFYGKALPKFNYSQIRPKGAFISGGFKAPGHAPLEKALNAIHDALSAAKGRRLRSFEAHRITCLLANAVVSAGVRRGALIAIFDVDDIEMRDCKTGNWFTVMPELARANNSAAVLPETAYSDYEKLFESARRQGEPGILFLKHKHIMLNPCGEVGMFPQIKVGDEIQYGWSTCNLTEINGGAINTEDDFMDAAKAAAILGTFQASYTEFKLMGETTKSIVERDALLGVGITGMAENPEILFNADMQQRAAACVKQMNQEVADIIGINHAVRSTVIKPSGNSSQLLGTSSGIHPFHFRKFIRHIQATHDEQSANVFAEFNPFAIEQSAYGADDSVLMYPISVGDDALIQDDLTAIEFIDMVKLTQSNWIEHGTNTDHPSYKENPDLRHNVSNTVKVKQHEWEIVKAYLWEHRESLCGVSMLPDDGDLTYPQAPYSSYLDGEQLFETYGAGAVLASGLIVDGLDVFETLHIACDTAQGIGETLEVTPKKIAKAIEDGVTDEDGEYVFTAAVNGLYITDTNAVIASLYDTMNKKIDWVRRFKQFAKNYMNRDVQKTANCLKHANRFYHWEKLRKMQSIDWDAVEWEEAYADAGSDTAQSCHGGACEI